LTTKNEQKPFHWFSISPPSSRAKNCQIKVFVAYCIAGKHVAKHSEPPYYT